MSHRSPNLLNFMRKLFGTDGIRGKAGEFPLNKKTVMMLGRSIALQFKEEKGENPKFIIGRDTRESGEWIEKAFHVGAATVGASSMSAGVITTPGVAYLTRKHSFDAGIVISASHNPYQDNGIKIFLPSGKKLGSDAEKTIEMAIHASDDLSLGDVVIDDSKSRFFQDEYVSHLADEFKHLSLSGFKMVIDCANGAASDLATGLFAGFGADVITINNEPDGKNINRDCGSLHLEKVQSKVLQEGADFGVALDGDADRSLFVDEKGNLVDGDATLWVMAQHLKKNGKLRGSQVVATVMSNIGLEIALNSLDVKLLRTDVGDKYVLEELQKRGASVGGEQSGHIIFPSFSLVGDGMQTTLFLLEALRENNKTLSEMRSGFKQYPQVLVNVRVKEKLPFEEVAEIAEKASEVESALGETGRLLLRYSGTENLARVMIEGENQSEVESLANDLASVINRNIGEGG